jgi:hypothetical protein
MIVGDVYSSKSRIAHEIDECWGYVFVDRLCSASMLRNLTVEHFNGLSSVSMRSLVIVRDDIAAVLQGKV